jgi:hypothetical protein
VTVAKPSSLLICKHCGTLNNGRAALPGNGWIEALLWLLWLFPGLLYSVWRRSGTGVCASCGKREFAPVETPMGRALVRRWHREGLPRFMPLARIPTQQTFVYGALRTAVLIGLCVGGAVALVIIFGGAPYRS